MCIAIGADQRGDIDSIATDIANEIAEDRECCDDIETLRGARRTNSAIRVRAINQKRIMITPRDADRKQLRTRPLTLPNNSDAR